MIDSHAYCLNRYLEYSFRCLSNGMFNLCIEFHEMQEMCYMYISTVAYMNDLFASYHVHVMCILAFLI